MTKRDDSIGPETGPDELERPKMVPPKDIPTPRVTDPDPPITASQAVELFHRLFKPSLKRLEDMHEMMMGVKMPDGTVKGGIGTAVHDVNNSAIILTEATHVIEDAFVDPSPPQKPGQPRETLPDRIARHCADRFVKLFQAEVLGVRDLLQREVSGLLEADESLLDRVKRLEEQLAASRPPAGPNGSHGSHGPAKE